MTWLLIILINILEVSSVTLILAKMDKKINESKLKKKTIFIISVVGIVFITTLLEIPLRELIITISALLFLKLLFDISIMEILFEFFFCLLYIMIAQIFIIFLSQIQGIMNESYLYALLANSILFVYCVISYYTIPLYKVIDIYHKFKKIFNFLIGIIMIPVVIFLAAWKIDINNVNYIPLVVSGIIIWTLIVAIIFNEILKIKEKQKAVEIYEEYNPLLQNLISDVKSKQHDIKNHLHVIYGIAEKNKDEELINYLESIITGYNFKESEQLLSVGNNIVSAILYSKKCESRNKNIELDFKYDFPIPAYPIEDYEIVDILGNLIDNAIDAIQSDIHNNKRVIINMKMENNTNVIEVKNTGKPISHQQIAKIFEKEFSTKGQNRGYGLFNVNRIVKSHHGNIEISHENGYTSFKVLFPAT